MQSGGKPHALQMGWDCLRRRHVKTRTRVVAWVFMLYSAAAFLILPTLALSSGWRIVLQGLPWAVQWPLWLGLLKGKSWSWRPLVGMHCLMLLLGISLLMRMPGYYMAHQSSERFRSCWPSILPCSGSWSFCRCGYYSRIGRGDGEALVPLAGDDAMRA